MLLLGLCRAEAIRGVVIVALHGRDSGFIRKDTSMGGNFVMQSNWLSKHRGYAATRPRTSAEWRAYFQSNAANQRPIPWQRGAETQPDELAFRSRTKSAREGCWRRVTSRRT